jgi:hypothetical protein
LPEKSDDVLVHAEIAGDWDGIFFRNLRIGEE